jgi:hypothetical protein
MIFEFEWQQMKGAAKHAVASDPEPGTLSGLKFTPPSNALYI